MKSDFDASSFRFRRLLAKSSQRTCLVHLLVYTLQLIVQVLLVKIHYTIAFELIYFRESYEQNQVNGVAVRRRVEAGVDGSQ